MIDELTPPSSLDRILDANRLPDSIPPVDTVEEQLRETRGRLCLSGKGIPHLLMEGGYSIPVSLNDEQREQALGAARAFVIARVASYGVVVDVKRRLGEDEVPSGMTTLRASYRSSMQPMRK